MAADGDLDAAVKAAWPYLGSVGGAIVSLAFLPKLTVRGRVLAFFVGSITATFVGPALIDLWFGGVVTYRVFGFLNFAISVSAMGTIPIALSRVKTLATKWTLLRPVAEPGDPTP